MEPTLKLSRHASLPLIMSLPIAALGGVFTVLFMLMALIPEAIDEKTRMLVIIFYTFLLPFLLIAVPLMSLLLRKSGRNMAIFDRGGVSFNDERYEFIRYDLIYYPIRPANYFGYRPGMLTLRPRGWEGINPEAPLKEIEVGCFTKGEIRRLSKLGLMIQIN